MSEMSVSEAVAEAGKFGNTLRAFAKLQEVAQFAQSQEQLRTEREAQLEDLRAQSEAAKAELARTQLATEQVGAANAQSVQTAREGAEKITADAHAQALQLLDEAAAEKAAAQAATNAAAARVSAAQAEVEAARVELKNLVNRAIVLQEAERARDAAAAAAQRVVDEEAARAQ